MSSRGSSSPVSSSGPSSRSEVSACMVTVRSPATWLLVLLLLKGDVALLSCKRVDQRRLRHGPTIAAGLMGAGPSGLLLLPSSASCSEMIEGNQPAAKGIRDRTGVGCSQCRVTFQRSSVTETPRRFRRRIHPQREGRSRAGSLPHQNLPGSSSTAGLIAGTVTTSPSGRLPQRRVHRDPGGCYSAGGLVVSLKLSEHSNSPSKHQVAISV